MSKNKTSINWIKKQNRDLYVRLSKNEGYRSRAVFKLKEIDQKYKILKNGISLIISRKNPKLLNSSHHEDDEMWGFTITRKLEPKGKKEMPRYQYLAPNGKILRFKSKSIIVRSIPTSNLLLAGTTRLI